MPLILNFTDTDDAEYPESYWRIVPFSANDRVKTGSFQMHGWLYLGAYLEGKDNIRASPKEFSITDPAVYDEYFGKARIVSDIPFLETLEAYAFNTDFFSSASQFSYIEAESGDIGSFNSSRIYIRFSDIVEFAPTGNYLSGVTIMVNGVSAAISAAAQDSPGSVIRYDLTTPVDANDVISWQYDAGAGFLVNAGGVPLADVPGVNVANLIGSYLEFDSEDNSGLLAAIA